MKKLKIIFLMTIFLFNFGSGAAYTSNSQIPSETIVWKIPKDQLTEWKEISRNLSENEGVVERIPVNQKKESWLNLVAMQYMKLSTVDISLKKALGLILESIKNATVSAYPGNKVTWNVIERNKSDVIYEWILHKPYGNTPAQHEVSRIVLTKEGFHRIGVTKKHEEMSPKEKETWITTFRNSVDVVPLDAADNIIEGLSMIEK